MTIASRSVTADPPLPAGPSRRWLRRAADAALAIVLAPSCAACDAPLACPISGALCRRCVESIVAFTPPLCMRCGDPLPSWRVISLENGLCPRCRRRASHVRAARAIGAYEGSLRSIVHALKYGRRPSLARALALRMQAHAGDLLRDADLAVPVPLHASRKRARGFNQAEELARHLDLPWRNALRRTRATPSQTDLPAARRHANVRDAFAARRRAYVDGLCVVLVDDVSTTGATLDACARALIDAGAREVRALTAARVVSLRP